jgi:hypothetical protein
MNAVKWTIGGVIGGLIGASVWTAITYFTQHEIGWIAWGVGIAVGLGVRMAAGDDDGPGPGVVAALIAIAALLGGKYATTQLFVNQFMKDMPAVQVTAQDVQLQDAAEIADAWTTEKKTLKWPQEQSLETAEAPEHFPPEVWKEVQKRWDELPPDQQTKRIATMEEGQKAMHAMLRGAMVEGAFKASFSPIDILFFVIAIASAFKLGSGAASGD